MTADKGSGAKRLGKRVENFFERAAPLALLRAQGWHKAASATSPARPDDAQRVSHWLLERVCRGHKFFESAPKLAKRYKKRGGEPAEQIAALVRMEVGRGFGVGFVAGLSGPLGAPVAIPVSLATTWLIQARLVAAIAHLYGHDIHDEAVRTAILIAINHEDEPSPREARSTSANMLSTVWQQASGPALSLLQRRAGQALLERTKQRRLVKLARGLPLLGAIAGGSVDGLSCLKVAERAQRLFQPTPTQKGD